MDTGKRLGDYLGRKDNNFTLLRLVLAWSVLFGHSFPLTGNGSDPVSMLMLPYTWIGSIAVGGFFAISGYLITGSFAQRGGMAFIASRALRLYPAVIVYCAVAVFVIGPIASDVPVREYFASGPWYYFKNVPLWEWNYNLPHVFTHTPMAGGTNGSTWTLPVELRCYLMVLILGFLGVLDKRYRANVVVIAALYFLYHNYKKLPIFGHEIHFAEPLNYFLWGMLFWINRSMIPMRWWIAAIAFIAPIVSVHTGYFGMITPPSVAYILYMLAYKTPHVDLDGEGKLGDISYGVYIYAWPIQQMIYWKGQSAWTNAAIATVIVAVLAYASWRLVEKPSLRLRKSLPKMGKLFASLNHRRRPGQGHDRTLGTGVTPVIVIDAETGSARA